VPEDDICEGGSFSSDAPWGPVANVLLGKFFTRYAPRENAYVPTPEMQQLFPDG
jgi:hypothetical protein